MSFHAFQLCFPCMSRSFVASHFPTSPVMPLCFVSLSFPLHSPCFHFCPLHVPCHVDFLFPPLISLHFLAFPLCSPIFPAKTRFSSVCAIRTSKNTEFFLAKGGRNPKPAKSRQGESSLEPLSCDTGSPKTAFSGTSSNCRAVRGPPPPHVSDVGRGGVRGGGSSILSLVSDTPRNVGGLHLLAARL